MTNTLASPRLEAVLGRLFAASAAQEADEMPAPPPGRASWAEASAAERADVLQDAYIPIAADAGKLLYALIRASRPETVVEFGTSFGISTIYLGAAVTDNGAGRVLTTELSSRKVEAARSNLKEAGVDVPVTILEGDARQTLADVPGPIGLVLLDGWKDLCLPVLRLLEPKLAPGAAVAADDITNPGMTDYLAYIRDPANGYVTVAFPVEDGMEISCWTGR
jgi:predicted O-methyltransferase YrrM